jgi:hypothetical protein
MPRPGLNKSLLQGAAFNASTMKAVKGYADLDIRFSKHFLLIEKIRLQAIFESFNLLNKANPAAVEQFQNLSIPIGTLLQYLPGRERQVGLRIEF